MISLAVNSKSRANVSARTEGTSLSEPGITFPAVSQQAFKDDYDIYHSTDPGLTVSAIIAHIDAQGDTLIDLRVGRPSLEERLLGITGIRGDQ